TTLGVWDALEAVACPILSVHVSEAGRLGVARFSAHEQKVPALGYVVPYHTLQKTLYEKMASHKNVFVKSIQSVDAIDLNTNTITINQTQKIQTDLIIAADGTQSTCRRLLAIPVIEKNPKDIAEIHTLTLSEPHTHTAYERFTEYGVLAVLPLLEKNKMQLVWTMTERIAEKIKTWDEEHRLQFLQQTFEGRLAIQTMKKISEFPLKTLIAKQQTLSSFVLLGNAAHTIYPVAAQGFNLGLRDVSLLQQYFLDLPLYEKKVSTHQKKIYNITSELLGLFELPLVGCARGAGLLNVDLIKPIKNKLAKRLMGMAP
ncbi:MAG: hypothetical protein ACD_70C00102G0001, partial [uncultured bacterium]